MRISVVIPALNEESAIGTLVALLGAADEVIVVDGGSADATVACAVAAGARVLTAPRGRGQQLHVGAMAATGDAFWFLHADSQPSPEGIAAIVAALTQAEAGVFRLRFGGVSRAARFMTWLYPWLTRVGFLYGDAGLFVRRATYFAAGGFAPVPLFEDLTLIRRLRREVRFVVLRTELTTSSRRFEGRFVRTWATWVALHVLFVLGVSPARLARWYGR